MSPASELLTPIYLKTSTNMELPTGLAAYFLVSSTGLFICRGNEFFDSCAPARSWPCELAEHHSSLVLRHPKIPQRQFEEIIGFFSAIADQHGAEAGALLVWHKIRKEVEVLVPEQLATVGESWSGKRYPIGLHYNRPTDLGPDRIIIADLHSHVFESAYSSYQDRYDEEYLAGLHIVIGRLDFEPPQFHAEFVVDGTRFKVESKQVVEGYEARSQDFPADWANRVSVKLADYGNSFTNANGWSKPRNNQPPRTKRYFDDDEMNGDWKKSNDS
jgi:hypothetical protein